MNLYPFKKYSDPLPKFPKKSKKLPVQEFPEGRDLHVNPKTFCWSVWIMVACSRLSVSEMIEKGS